MAREGKAKRAALVEAAKALLWEQGFTATSPRDVLARAGAGQGSLYHHFPGKLDLAATALAEMAAEEIAAVDALFDPGRPPLDRVRLYLLREREALRGCRLGRLAQEAAITEPRLREPVAAYLAHVRRRLADSLGAARARGHLPSSLDPEALAAALLAIVEGGYVLARARWDPAAMSEAVEGGLQLLTAVSRPG
jgi:TetR/AcrR family transcriptional regulator, transcriptional repressor for nem operon